MRITVVRLISQIFFMGLFFFFCFVTQFSYLKGYPVSIFLEVDPLVAIATAITTHTLYQGLVWSLVLLIPTLSSVGFSAIGSVPTAFYTSLPVGCLTGVRLRKTSIAIAIAKSLRSSITY